MNDSALAHSTTAFIDHGTGGSPDCMHLASRARPTPGPGEVLIEVAYAGVNRPDVLQRSGSYPPPPGASPYLGLEVSGHIVALGEGATRWRVGDAVCALVPGGGYAQYCVTHATHCLPVPNGMSLLEAAALPETYFTVWTNVFERGRLQAGETFLVHGGSSGIGLTAIQLAHELGARVFTTVGNHEKAQACLAAGAERAIHYRDEDFVAAVKSLTNNEGVNLILDMVGGSYMPRNIQSLALEGRLVQIAFLEGSRLDIDATPIMLRRLTITGSTLRARSTEQKAAIAASLEHTVWPWLEAGRARPVIHRVLPLAEVRAAHALMESSAHIGKIVLNVGEL
ncbi:NAD(P)H-quinone oxidoreductase [Pararobbsia silviterrae]|uniref:NAD(P)H-quinone oxidoreductase n=1 Tax=Pararobbsia silviterrae TaxID=1792498 RepID=A0A494XUV4_9BURK|nr:NAD(P)H-quinone oxidoreductase [Pararobbsia silviterrae]RKP51884.1 NAD(P)H-quinone oxidoreductase [Pararobbsia silviterrae]